MTIMYYDPANPKDGMVGIPQGNKTVEINVDDWANIISALEGPPEPVLNWDGLLADLMDPSPGKGGAAYNELLMLSSFPAPGDAGAAAAISVLNAAITTTSKSTVLDNTAKLTALQSALVLTINVMTDRGIYTPEKLAILRSILDANGFTSIVV